MSIEACAELVRRGDPDRFLATMAAPAAARRVLFPLYAFNLEVARAPWVTQETMIAEMRLQWWRDALAEIADNKPARRHEVVTPLANVLSPTGAALLDRLVEARRWDIYKDPFEDEAHFDRYIAQTSGHLMWAAAEAMGAPEGARDAVVATGTATGLVRFLQAVPALEDKGRRPLVAGKPADVSHLAKRYLTAMDVASPKTQLPKAARPALIEAWQTRVLLKQIARDPMRVANGAVGLSPAMARLRLLIWR